MKKILLVCVLILLVMAGIFIWRELKENPQNESGINSESEIEIVIDPVEMKVVSKAGTITYSIDDYEKDLFLKKHYVSLDYLKEVYRLVYTYEARSNTLNMVYEDTTFSFDFSEKTYKINNTQEKENDLIYKVGDVFYLDIEKFQTFFEVDYYLVDDPFTIIELDFSKSGARLENIDKIVNMLPEKINMTWEAVYNVPTNIEYLYDMPGLDIISPIWFNLLTGEGEFDYKLQEDYIQWSKDEGYLLWPGITNSFDLELTRTMVSSSVNRTVYINKLLAIYKSYNFHGINVDFENMYKEDSALLNQFIAELTAAFHRENMLVSMDVTFPGGSDTWSKCFDHEVLGQWVDFMVIMAYDQHWASSPISGTVAGMDWLNRNIPNLLALVNSDKVVLAMPFYMRVWYERPSIDQVNQMKVTSDSITMHEMENIFNTRDLNVLWDEKNGQNYASYINHTYDAVNKVWIEDARSLALKVELVHDYNLKGIASWRRGYELESIWPVLEEALRKR